MTKVVLSAGKMNRMVLPATVMNHHTVAGDRSIVSYTDLSFSGILIIIISDDIHQYGKDTTTMIS